MSKKILILGGARFHGFQIAECLAEKGEEVFVLNRGNFKSEYPTEIHHLIADRNNLKDFKKTLGGMKFDVIIDNNAYTPEQINLISEIIKNNCNHYIFTSSASVYLRLFSGHKLKEEEATGIQKGDFNPKIVNYALNKFASENAIRELKKNHTILRFPDIFGEGDFAGKLSYFNKKLKNNEKIFLEKEIDRFSFIYVKDVINIFEKILDNEKCFGKTINFADPESHTFEEFFNLIFGDKCPKNSLVFLPAQKIWEARDSSAFVWTTPIDTSLSEELLGKIEYTPLKEWGLRALKWEIENLK